MDEFAEILKRLPHRYPFLMVDKVIEATQHDITAIKNVTANESYMQGHFPGNPIMPGVMIIEALLQTGGLLAGCSTDIPVGNCTVAVVTMEKMLYLLKLWNKLLFLRIFLMQGFIRKQSTYKLI